MNQIITVCPHHRDKTRSVQTKNGKIENFAVRTIGVSQPQRSRIGGIVVYLVFALENKQINIIDSVLN